MPEITAPNLAPKDFTRLDQEKIESEFSWAISKLVSKSIRVITESFEDMRLIDLLMALPIKPEFKEVDLSKMHNADGTPIQPDEIAIGGYTTRDTLSGNPNRLCVFFVFTKDVNVTWGEFFERMVHVRETKLQASLTFVYLHEAMHILMRHYDYYLNIMYLDIIDQYRPEMADVDKYRLLNYGFDYWINGYLLEQAKSNSTIGRMKNAPDFPWLYDPNLSPSSLEIQEIVIRLAKEAKISTVDLRDINGDLWGTSTSITINGITTTTVDLHDAHTLEFGDVIESESNVQEINTVLTDTRTSLLEKSKGTGGVGSFAKLGVDYSVPTDWFKYLKSSIFTLSQKYTSKYEQTWGKLKTKMRHISTMPGKVYYDKEMAVIVSIDQSGSMSNTDLEKINYVVTELAKKAVFTEILLHDTQVASRERFIGKKFKGIRDYVTTRVACGGTSHREVFDIIKEIYNENKKRKLIYLSFSDNYSDIEQVYDGALFDKIPAYWIVTQGGKPVNVPGMQIALDNGLLQR